MGRPTIYQQIWAYAHGNRMSFAEAAREFSRRRHGRVQRKKQRVKLEERSLEDERRAFEELERRGLA